MARPWRLFWLLVLSLHAVAASAWWWLTPGGFPFSHPRFWSNSVAPLVVLAVVVAAVMAARRERLERLRASLAAFPAAWCASALVGRFVFPITLGRLFVVPLIGAGLMAGALVMTFRRKVPAAGWPVWGVVLVAALFGAVSPLSQRPPEPDTRPLNLALPETVSGTIAPSPNGRLGERLFVHVGDGSATVKAGGLTLSVQPLLRFLARSPDGCLTILAPPAIREGPDLRLTSAAQDENGLSLTYRADYDATLQVGPDAGAGPIVLESTARLTRPIESHLNSFCDVEVSGHKRLALSFSPCPDQRIEVRPADYPVGRPLRFAYMDAAGSFHVVEGTSGEKGPFRELAGGRLGRSEPLAITLHDGDAAVARITLDDWSAQAGTALSPTAGWGAPVNAIEFSLEGDAPGSRAAIYITLAGTSVGRGWDCVGHAVGTYRNRLRIETLGVRPAAEAARNPDLKAPLP
ncbi:MAG: hypothetical protein P4L85_04160 [Paludisphaera borealis]|uniref:hypothetical protein n=1 Tax=Paludisphaera borealis TaxID=1387353 RepID=UPI00283D85F6|nr:hypothetical protein [Paludisphaera borealis]MDR3618522.1 hypothetical protein [Paludisphaera borealis]